MTDLIAVGKPEIVSAIQQIADLDDLITSDREASGDALIGTIRHEYPASVLTVGITRSVTAHTAQAWQRAAQNSPA